MGKGPGSFYDIGKKAKDLLTKDFVVDQQKVTISSSSSSGVHFHTTGTKKGEAFSSEVKAEYKHGNVKTEVKIDTKAKVHGSFTFESLAPGLKLGINGNVLEQKTYKVDMHYSGAHVHSTSAVGLTPQPLLEGTLTVGAEGFSVGAEVAFDTATSSTTKYNFAAGLVKDDFHAAVLLSDKADTIKASYVHQVNPNSTVGVEIAHKFSKNDITFTAGAAYKMDPLTMTKFRLNNRGNVAALVQHEWRPKSTITLSSEVDSKNLEKSAKFGLALHLKP